MISLFKSLAACVGAKKKNGLTDQNALNYLKDKKKKKKNSNKASHTNNLHNC